MLELVRTITQLFTVSVTIFFAKYRVVIDIITFVSKVDGMLLDKVVVITMSKYFNVIGDNNSFGPWPVILSTFWLEWLFSLNFLSMTFTFIFSFARMIFDSLCLGLIFLIFDWIFCIWMEFISSLLEVKVLDLWEYNALRG